MGGGKKKRLRTKKRTNGVKEATNGIAAMAIGDEEEEGPD